MSSKRAVRPAHPPPGQMITYVKTVNEETVTLFTNPSMSIATIKEMLQQELKMLKQKLELPPKFQILTLGEQVLEDTDTLETLNIETEETLMLQSRYNPSMNSIRVIVDDNTRTKAITVKHGTSVEELKAMILESYGFAAEEGFKLAIVYNGSSLEPGKTMDDYEVQENGMMKVIMELEGGIRPRLNNSS